MSISNLFIVVGLLLTLIGCLIEIIGMFNIKNKKLYSSILMSGLMEQNIIDGFKLKYRQIEGFIFILIGTILQIVPNIFIMNFKIKSTLVTAIVLILIIISFLIDKSTIKFSKIKYDEELNRRKNK